MEPKSRIMSTYSYNVPELEDSARKLNEWALSIP